MTIERDELGFDAPAPLGHPGRVGLPAGHPTGPEVGGPLPDFTLPDAFGKPVHFDEALRRSTRFPSHRRYSAGNTEYL